MKKIFYLIGLIINSLLFIQCETKDETKIKYNYVDLGLSVKWATCNIGAQKPEKSGNYFAWGEVQTKEFYNWDTYKYGTEKNLTKYNSFDKKNILDLEDDAAAVNWGENWRIPTFEEQKELIDNCTWTFTTLNGIKGYKVTSKIAGYTNCSIFLPFTGYMYDNQICVADDCSYYISSTLDTNEDGVSYLLFISQQGDQNYVHIGSHVRSMGTNIRPVCP